MNSNRFRLIMRRGFDDGVQRQLERIVDEIGVVAVLDRLATLCGRRGEAEHDLAQDRESLWDDFCGAISGAMDACHETIASEEEAV